MFTEFLAASRQEPFLWGKNDCALWCASAVESATGYDPASDLRGTYSTWFECRRVIMAAGGMEALIAPRMARFDPLIGDGVALVHHDGMKICGLINKGRLILKMQAGMVFRDEFTVIRGWSWSRQ